MKKYKVKKSECFPDGIAIIYTREEAIREGIAFLPIARWTDVKVGEYAATMDGYVTPCIARRDNGRNGTYIKTPTGCFNPLRRGTIFDTEEFYNRNSFSRKPRWAGTKKLRPQQQKMFDVFKETLDIDLAFKVAYPKVNAETRRYLIPYIIRSKVFRDMTKKEIAKLAEAKGLSLELLVERLADAARDLDPKAANFPVVMKMAARILGEDVLELPANKKSKELPPGNQALFDNAEDADFEDETDKDHLKYIRGPVREKVG